MNLVGHAHVHCFFLEKGNFINFKSLYRGIQLLEIFPTSARMHTALQRVLDNRHTSDYQSSDYIATHVPG